MFEKATEAETPKSSKPSKQFSLHRPGQISPRPEIKFELKLYQMNADEVRNMGEHLKIPLSGNLPDKKAQIDAHLREIYPDHKRTLDGHLVFETSFDPSTKYRLSAFSSHELKAIIKAYDLPAHSAFATKAVVYKHVKKHLLKKYPAAEMIDDDIVFTINRPKTPESGSRTMELRSSSPQNSRRSPQE